VREVMMLLGDHRADDHVNQPNDSSHPRRPPPTG
jgi:hypothetical protein